MRILHIIPSISPHRGGPSTAIIEIVKALREDKVNASILTTNDHGNMLNKNLIIGQWHSYQGVPVLAFERWNPPIGFIKEYNISLSLTCWLMKHINQYDLLHIHAMFSYPSTASMILARSYKVPYILRTIGQLDSWSLSQKPLRKKIMLGLIERRNIDSAVALHFTSDKESECMGKMGFANTRLVIPLGVNIPYGRNKVLGKNTNKVTTFLFLSRIHPKKNLSNLITALALVQKWQPESPWELLIAGTGDSKHIDELHHQIKKLSIDERCNWLGFLEGENKWNALKMADWLVLPSASENFGIVVAEAMAAGTPVIISPQVAISEMVMREGAGLISNSNPPELAKTLQKALDGPSNKMKEAALSTAQSYFSWKSVAKSLKSFYSDNARV